MPKVRIFTEDVRKRILRADEVICKWMIEARQTETTPEECIDILVDAGIYKKKHNGEASYFREDLRNLKANSKLDIFENITVDKINGYWIITKKLG